MANSPIEIRVILTYTEYGDRMKKEIPEFFDPKDERLSVEDSRKLIGLLARETDMDPIALPPIFVRLARQELGESDFERLAMKLAMEELKRRIEDKKAER